MGATLSCLCAVPRIFFLARLNSGFLPPPSYPSPQTTMSIVVAGEGAHDDRRKRNDTMTGAPRRRSATRRNQSNLSPVVQNKKKRGVAFFCYHPRRGGGGRGEGGVCSVFAVRCRPSTACRSWCSRSSRPPSRGARRAVRHIPAPRWRWSSRVASVSLLNPLLSSPCPSHPPVPRAPEWRGERVEGGGVVSATCFQKNNPQTERGFVKVAVGNRECIFFLSSTPLSPPHWFSDS